MRPRFLHCLWSALAVWVLLPVAAQAQIIPFAGNFGPGLAPSDNQMLFDSVARLNATEPSKVGQSDSWSNPETKSHFEQFCDVHKIVVSDQPLGTTVSANWREEIGDAERRLMFSARHHDLVVLGRRTGLNGLPPDLIERISLGCGRPLLIAPPQPPRLLVGTVMVCWKQTPEAARALAAAMPLLVNADRVVLAGAEERDASLAAGLADLSRQLAWHGNHAEVDFLSSVAGPVRKVLLTAAQSHNADLLVMGAYRHSRTRQIVFGEVTQSVLEAAEIAVLLMH